MTTFTRPTEDGLRGVFAAALTPMGDNLSIHREAFAAHCRRLLDAGCHGLGVFGTTGEATSFSADERIRALEQLVEDGIPGATLLPGAGSPALTDAVRLTRAAVAAGAAGALLLPPFYYKGVSDDGLFRFFAEVIERVGDARLRVYLYHIPPQTQIGFSLELIGRLLDAYPGVVAGVKDSSGDVARMEQIARAYPGLAVFPGTERHLLAGLRWGGAGCISATVNVTSRLAREVFDAHEAGRDEESAELQERLTAMRLAIEAHPVVPALKGMMGELTGDPVWQHVRPPLPEVDPGRTRALLDELPVPALL